MNVKHIMTWPVFSIGPDATRSPSRANDAAA